MDYPQSFIEKCKQVFPDWTRLHELLEARSEFAGRYLDDASTTHIPVQDVLSANSLEQLKAKAENIKQRLDLYAEWCELYRNSRK